MRMEGESNGNGNGNGVVSASSNSRNHLVFGYNVTSHGFGHATRVVEVVRHLIMASYEVHVVTNAHPNPRCK
ncbi:hypothetical protein CsatB_023352 [Cannabis sativa]